MFAKIIACFLLTYNFEWVQCKAWPDQPNRYPDQYGWSNPYYGQGEYHTEPTTTTTTKPLYPNLHPTAPSAPTYGQSNDDNGQRQVPVNPFEVRPLHPNNGGDNRYGNSGHFNHSDNHFNQPHDNTRNPATYKPFDGSTQRPTFPTRRNFNAPPQANGQFNSSVHPSNPQYNHNQRNPYDAFPSDRGNQQSPVNPTNPTQYNHNNPNNQQDPHGAFPNNRYNYAPNAGNHNQANNNNNNSSSHGTQYRPFPNPHFYDGRDQQKSNNNPLTMNQTNPSGIPNQNNLNNHYYPGYPNNQRDPHNPFPRDRVNPSVNPTNPPNYYNPMNQRNPYAPFPNNYYNRPDQTDPSSNYNQNNHRNPYDSFASDRASTPVPPNPTNPPSYNQNDNHGPYKPFLNSRNNFEPSSGYNSQGNNNNNFTNTQTIQNQRFPSPQYSDGRNQPQSSNQHMDNQQRVSPYNPSMSQMSQNNFEPHYNPNGGMMTGTGQNGYANPSNQGTPYQSPAGSQTHRTQSQPDFDPSGVALAGFPEENLNSNGQGTRKNFNYDNLYHRQPSGSSELSNGNNNGNSKIPLANYGGSQVMLAPF